MLEKKPEYWRWEESRWTNPEISNPKSGEIITAGVDIGSTSTQAVILVDGELYAYSNMPPINATPSLIPRLRNIEHILLPIPLCTPFAMFSLVSF